jgi:7-carboxy-7-deazaguanine synthase (Cx14CxxC type)
MGYRIKEIYYTIQGEGANTGRPAVFCRFSGCNLWTGREEDRSAAICNFCDTDFYGTDGPGGGKYSTADEVVEAIASRWPSNGRAHTHPFIVLTGGEPLLQLDEELLGAMHRRGMQVAVETNGTVAPPSGIDWICVSPKAGSELILRTGHELKLIFPQPGAEPPLFASLPFQHFFLQPMDGPDRVKNTASAVQYCLEHPHWKLSLQTHKLLGLR